MTRSRASQLHQAAMLNATQGVWFWFACWLQNEPRYVKMKCHTSTLATNISQLINYWNDFLCVFLDGSALMWSGSKLKLIEAGTEECLVTSLLRLQEAARRNILQPAALRLRWHGATTCHRPWSRSRSRASYVGSRCVRLSWQRKMKRTRLRQTDTPMLSGDGCFRVFLCSEIKKGTKT